MAVEHDLLSLKPADTPDVMIPVWLGCVSWCLSDDGIVEAFRSETKNQWRPGRTGLESMIDRATDADWQFLEAFVVWVNENFWGPIDGPTG